MIESLDYWSREGWKREGNADVLVHLAGETTLNQVTGPPRASPVKRDISECLSSCISSLPDSLC